MVPRICPVYLATHPVECNGFHSSDLSVAYDYSAPSTVEVGPLYNAPASIGEKDSAPPFVVFNINKVIDVFCDDVNMITSILVDLPYGVIRSEKNERFVLRDGFVVREIVTVVPSCTITVIDYKNKTRQR